MGIMKEERKKNIGWKIVKKNLQTHYGFVFFTAVQIDFKNKCPIFWYAVNFNNLSLSLYLFLNSISSKLRLKRERFKIENLRLTIFFSFFELRCALALLSINQLDNNRKTNLLMYTPLWQTPRARHYYLAGLSEHSLKLVGLWSTDNMPAELGFDGRAV